MLDIFASSCITSCDENAVANDAGTQCVCDASKFFVLGKDACECDSSNNFVLADGKCVCDVTNKYYWNLHETGCVLNCGPHAAHNDTACKCTNVGYTQASLDGSACVPNCTGLGVLDGCECDSENGFAFNGTACACDTSLHLALNSKNACVCNTAGGYAVDMWTGLCVKDCGKNAAAVGGVCACSKGAMLDLNNESCVKVCDLGQVGNEEQTQCVCDESNNFVLDTDTCICMADYYPSIDGTTCAKCDAFG